MSKPHWSRRLILSSAAAAGATSAVPDTSAAADTGRPLVVADQGSYAQQNASPGPPCCHHPPGGNGPALVAHTNQLGAFTVRLPILTNGLIGTTSARVTTPNTDLAIPVSLLVVPRAPTSHPPS